MTFAYDSQQKELYCPSETIKKFFFFRWLWDQIYKYQTVSKKFYFY